MLTKLSVIVGLKQADFSRFQILRIHVNCMQTKNIAVLSVGALCAIYKDACRLKYLNEDLGMYF